MNLMPNPKPLTAAQDTRNARISEERIADLLDIAAEVFFEHGYEAASVGEMARRAKASKATFYSRYPTKELLFVAVIRRKTDHSFERFRTMFQESATAETALLAFGHELLSLVLQPDALSLLRILYMEARNFPEMGRSFYEHGFRRLNDTLTTYLRSQVRAGNLRVENIRLAAEQFGDGLVGEPTRRLALGVDGPLTAREQDQRVRYAVRTFLDAHASIRSV